MTSSQTIIERLNDTSIADFKSLIELFKDVFELPKADMPGENYLRGILVKPGFIVFVAKNDDEILGGLTAHILPTYHHEAGEIFIYDIAVKTESQRQGLGKLLLESLKKYAAEIGINELFVAAHEEDHHALDFYTSAGGEAEKVVHFDFSNNPAHQ